MKEMIRKLIKQNKPLVLCSVLLVFTVAAAIIARVSQKQLEADIVIPTMVCDRYFYPLDFAHNEGQKAEIPLAFVKEGTPLPDLVLNTAYPVFQNNGATMYLYEDNYLMVTDTYEELAGTAGVIAGEGTVFDEGTSLPIQEHVLFLKYPDIDAYVSLVPIRLEGEVTDTIPQYALFFLREDRLEIYEYYRGRLKYRTQYVSERAFVLCGEEKYTFYEWKARMRHEDASVQNPQIQDEVSFYFYDMTERFSTDGEIIFRRAGDGNIVLENGKRMFDVQHIPLYLEGGEAVLLAGGFCLVQPWIQRMNAVPEMTYLVPDLYAVYLEKEDWSLAAQNAFIYDGGSHYILLDETEFVMGDVRMTLAPLSSVTVESETKFSIYEYGTKEFSVHYITGAKPKIQLGYGLSLLPMQGIMEKENGELVILISDVSVLPLLK